MDNSIFTADAHRILNRAFLPDVPLTSLPIVKEKNDKGCPIKGTLIFSGDYAVAITVSDYLPCVWILFFHSSVFYGKNLSDLDVYENFNSDMRKISLHRESYYCNFSVSFYKDELEAVQLDRKYYLTNRGIVLPPPPDLNMVKFIFRSMLKMGCDISYLHDGFERKFSAHEKMEINREITGVKNAR